MNLLNLVRLRATALSAMRGRAVNDFASFENTVLARPRESIDVNPIECTGRSLEIARQVLLQNQELVLGPLMYLARHANILRMRSEHVCDYYANLERNY